MKVFLDTVGCRLNQSELEQIALHFRALGHSLVSNAVQADLAVINTCSVTARAAADSRQKARQAARAGVRDLVLTGCWSTLEPQAAASLPGVTRLIANEQKDALVSLVLSSPNEAMDREPLAREPLPGLRHRTRAFLKVQDGCDNRCTFCVTTIARGSARSYTPQAVLKEVDRALRSGYKEIVLTGVHLGSWGRDLVPRRHLKDLVQQILDQTEVPRLRLSSLEPWDLDQTFFHLWRDSRLCPHLHLPLQSGSSTVLRRMARKTLPGHFADLVDAARGAVPEMAITTDLIAGFPGETEEEHAQTVRFVEEIGFSGGHVFPYSERLGTAAATMPSPVPSNVRKMRAEVLRQILANSAAQYRQRFVGQRLSVLWESAHAFGKDGWHLCGLTPNYLRVYARAPRSKLNTISEVRVEAATSFDLQAECID